MNKYLVLDIGGSSIKYAKMNDKAEFLDKGKVKTPKTGIREFVETIGSIYDKYKHEISGIAISMPGILDSERGYAYTGGNLVYNADKEIVKILKERCPVDITIENDGKCAALAEVWKGSLKECKDGIVIVLGTGIGGGIIIDRKIYKGGSFSAGEFSFIRTNADNPDEVDNLWALKNGSSALIKATAQVKGLKEDEVDGIKVFEYANNGDEEVLKILDEFTRCLAVQIINLGFILNPQKVAIGGGISDQPILFEYINKNLKRNSDILSGFSVVPKLVVEKCTFGNDSNLIGALYNFLKIKK